MRDYSEEHEERFHQDIIEFERRSQARYIKITIGDFIWVN